MRSVHALYMETLRLLSKLIILEARSVSWHAIIPLCQRDLYHWPHNYHIIGQPPNLKTHIVRTSIAIYYSPPIHKHCLKILTTFQIWYAIFYFRSVQVPYNSYSPIHTIQKKTLNACFWSTFHQELGFIL